MSEQLQPIGQPVPGGGYSVAVTVTVSKPTVEWVPWLWEVTAKPAREGAGEAGHRASSNRGRLSSCCLSGDV